MHGRTTSKPIGTAISVLSLMYPTFNQYNDAFLGVRDVLVRLILQVLFVLSAVVVAIIPLATKVRPGLLALSLDRIPIQL